MTYGIQTFDSNGNITFDSSTENVMFEIAEEYITANQINRNAPIYYSYPAYTGKKICAFMQSPFNDGDVDGWAVLSCRVSYPNGVPTVAVFVDNNKGSYPICTGYLTVLYTGAPQ